MSKRKRISKEAKLNKNYLELYQSWKRVFCPALNEDVHFTNKGWQHIQQEKWRTRGEKEERLKLLSEAKNILGKTTTTQEKRLQLYHGTLHTHYTFKSLQGNIKQGGVLIGVVVIEDKGQYDFLSVFRV